MAKYTPQTLTTGFHSTSQINQNFSDAADAIEKQLSRDGTTPNEMEADLDLNGNRILNLPEAISDLEPLRKMDVDTAALSTVIGMQTDIDLVNANAANITTVAGVSTNVTTVATDITNVNTSAVNIAGINTTAANVANINTLAGISGDVTTVAGIAADVTAAASNIPKANRTAIVAPTVTDDSASGYSAGSQWIDTVLGQEYVCIDASVGAAVWKVTSIVGLIQHIHTLDTTSVDVTSASTVYVDAGALTITPTSITNKVIAKFNFTLEYNGQGAAGVQITRDGTPIYTNPLILDKNNNPLWAGNVNIEVVDIPGALTPVNYKLTIRRETGTGTVTRYGGATSPITLQLSEIAV